MIVWQWWVIYGFVKALLRLKVSLVGVGQRIEN
jgi:hypothetical protein